MEPSYSVGIARSSFLGAVAQVNPEVLTELRASCLPKLEVILPASRIASARESFFTASDGTTFIRDGLGWRSPQLHGLTLQGDDAFTCRQLIALSHDPAVSALASAVDQWSAKFHIEVEWVKQAALDTMRHWLCEPGDNLWHDTMCRMGSDDLPQRGRINHQFEVSLGPWFFEPEKNFRERARQEFDTQLNRYVERLREFYSARGYDPDSRINEDHLRWFAAFQTLEEAPREVLKRFKISKTESAVLDAVKRTSEKIGLPVRKSQNLLKTQRRFI